MMISNKLHALRNLFAQHARVALLSEQGEIGVEQHQLAKLYAKTYRQSYHQVLWLDANSPSLLRLSCLQQCQQLGLIGNDPLQQLLSWLQHQTDLLLIVEHAHDPQLWMQLQDQPHHMLFCTALANWPNEEIGLLRLNLPNSCLPEKIGQRAEINLLLQELDGNWQALQLAHAWMQQQHATLPDYLRAFTKCLQTLPTASKHPGNNQQCHQDNHLPSVARAAFLLNQAQLGEKARRLLGICAWLGPQALPYQLLLQAESADDLAAWDAAAQQLHDYQLGILTQLPNPAGGSWPGLEFAPAIQSAQRLFGSANDAYDAQTVLHDMLCQEKLPLSLVPLISSHLEYLFTQRQLDAGITAGLLQQLEAHYQHLPHESEVLLRRILNLRAQLECNQNDIATTLACQNLLAQNLKAQGRLNEAQDLLCATLQEARTALGEDAPQVGIYLSNLARLFAQRGQHLAAVELEQQALEGLRRNLGDTHPHVLAVMHNLAHSLQHIPADKKAEKHLMQLVQLHLSVFGEMHWRTQEVMDLLSGCLFQQNKLYEAAKWSERVLTIRRQLFGLEHAETTVAAYDLMCLHLEIEQFEKAYQIYQECLAWLQTSTHLNEQQRQIMLLLHDMLPSSRHEPAASMAFSGNRPHILH